MELDLLDVHGPAADLGLALAVERSPRGERQEDLASGLAGGVGGDAPRGQARAQDADHLEVVLPHLHALPDRALEGEEEAGDLVAEHADERPGLLVDLGEEAAGEEIAARHGLVVPGRAEHAWAADVLALRTSAGVWSTGTARLTPGNVASIRSKSSRVRP